MQAVSGGGGTARRIRRPEPAKISPVVAKPPSSPRRVRRAPTRPLSSATAVGALVDLARHSSGYQAPSPTWDYPSESGPQYLGWAGNGTPLVGAWNYQELSPQQQFLRMLEEDNPLVPLLAPYLSPMTPTPPQRLMA